MFRLTNKSTINEAAMDRLAETSETGQKTDWRQVFTALCKEEYDECLRIYISEYTESNPSLLKDFDFLDAATDALADEHYSLMTGFLYDYDELDKVKQLHYILKVVREAMIRTKNRGS